MKTEIIAIIKKELFRLFSDKRLVFMTILFPGIMIYVMYSLMGNYMFSSHDTISGSCIAIHTPASFSSWNTDLNVTFTEDSEENLTSDLQLLEQSAIDLVIVFPENFDEITAVDPTVTEVPEVKIYYNSSSETSSTLYEMYSEMLSAYENSITDVFSINSSGDYDVASDDDMTGMILSSILPMLLMMLLFSACISIGPESISGEKERGTLATLLVTPINRTSLAIGKIVSMSIIALLSGTSSFLGTMLSLPKLMNLDDSSTIAIYSPVDYAMLFIIITLTVFVMIGIVSVLSAFAKNVKEASSLTSPFVVLVVLISLFPSFVSTESTFYYCIPLVNSAFCLKNIFQFQMQTTDFCITLVANLIAIILLVGILAKMFNNEKLIYTK